MKKCLMVKSKFALLIAAYLIALYGCNKDWLDKKPDQSITILTSLNDYEALLDGLTSYNSPLSLGDIASDGHSISEANWLAGIPDFKINTYTWTRERPNINNPYWNSSYTVVFYANLVLEGISKIRPETADEQIQYNRIKGNALYQRSRIFFELAQLWTPPYIDIQQDNVHGIPLRLESDINLPTRRSTIKETYNQIFNDLQAASVLLPSIPATKVRASRVGVYALLARIHLALENYLRAGQYADSCLAIYDKLIDYNTLADNVNFVGHLNDEVIFHSNQLESSKVPSEDQIGESLYNTYDNNDLRKTIFFNVDRNGIIFKGNYFNSSNQLFTGLATDEMYLIRSECFAREGKTEEAMDDINRFLHTRWKNSVSYPQLTATNAEDALVLILNERKKSLLFRGVRWMDLRRLNKDPRFEIVITHTIAGNTYVLEPNSYKYTLPIPDDIILMSNISQNPHWNK